MSTDGLKFIHTSDWHLGAPVDWRPAEVKEGPWISLFRSYRKKAIEDIVEKAISNEVAGVLVAGDVIDIYGYEHITKNIMFFLEQKVINPLRDHGIKIIFTIGTHDQNSVGALQLLVKLQQTFPSDVEILLPKELTSQLGKSLFKNSTDFGSVVISCDPPSERCPWIEFRHKSNGLPTGNLPLYRAFGDKHILSFKTNRTFFPGTPFARSSGSDNQFTDVGPRYCLLYEVGNHQPDPIKLKIPEIAVLKKVPFQDRWSLVYARDHYKDKWVPEALLEGKPEEILPGIMARYPDIKFVTFVIDRREQMTFSSILLRRLWHLVGGKERVITGSRDGIITVMLKTGLFSG